MHKPALSDAEASSKAIKERGASFDADATYGFPGVADLFADIARRFADTEA